MFSQNIVYKMNSEMIKSEIIVLIGREKTNTAID
jgi:hypothetical protein